MSIATLDFASTEAAIGRGGRQVHEALVALGGVHFEGQGVAATQLSTDIARFRY